MGALLFTWLQVRQTGEEVRISEQGQITTRFNAAIGNLGSGSMDVRLGGIYALERIMKDSQPDQNTVVSVLTAYIRQHAPVQHNSSKPEISADIAAAMNVLVRRHPQHDEITIDLRNTRLRGWTPSLPNRSVIALREAILSGADLHEAKIARADLRGAQLDRTDLSGADMTRANLSNSVISQAQLRDTDFTGANLSGASFCRGSETEWLCSDLTDAVFFGADLRGANLSNADLRNVLFCDHGYDTSYRRELGIKNPCATLQGTTLDGTNLQSVNLQDADLSDANLDVANLRHADLRHANLRNASFGYTDLSYANLTGADLTGSDLTNAILEGTEGLPPNVSSPSMSAVSRPQGQVRGR